MGARACLQDADNLRLSAPQIWDCAGIGGTTNCSLGGSLIAMLDNLGGAIDTSAVALLPDACDETLPPQHMPTRDPNITACYSRFAHCSSGRSLAVQSTLYVDMVYFVLPLQPLPFEASLIATEMVMAMRMLMGELWVNGPVVSVLTLRGGDIAAFFGISASSDVFDPRATVWQPVKRHCIMVYGWGVDEPSDVPFWRVQNSLGAAWGDGGTGRIVRGRGILEHQWRAPALVRRPCSGGSCLPLDAYGNYSTRTAVLDNASNNNGEVEYWSSAQDSIVLSTGAIIGVALGGSVLLIGAFAGFLLLAGDPRHHHHYSYVRSTI